MELSSLAGWNQTPRDWHRLIALSPDSCFGIDCQGKLAATATLVCYGTRLAWVGMVLTRPEFRCQGMASHLLERVLAESDRRGIRTLKLDATPQGRPIYERRGFLREQDVERWSGIGSGAAELRNGPSFDPGLDLAAFGADRQRLMESLGGDRREGRVAYYFGPCVAPAPDEARAIIAAALTQATGPWFWDLLPANTPAVQLAAEFGFRPDRHLVRMFRGEPFRGDDSKVYAIAGFEFG